jgi:hypothetical protein
MAFLPRAPFRGMFKGSALAATAVLVVALIPASAIADTDPRIGLGAGWKDAQSASSNMELLGHSDKPPGFFDPANPGNFGFLTSDLALGGNHAFTGNFNGFNIFDISNPNNPAHVTSVVCPGGQGDLSVHGNLLFMSVEETRARVDCGTDPTQGTRFQGVRIFDISNVASPVQVAAVQTCRGSHTHSLLADPDDPNNLYVYVSGTAGPRPATTLAGCNNNPANGENPSRWRIDIIKVPLADPAAAAVVGGPRLFTDPATGALDGLQNTPPTPLHPSGTPWSPTPTTDSCHDITTFPAIGLAAGACEGNGILIDISDPENPVRIDQVSDPNFAYWHSATFNNDGTKVVFTDEWGGGTSARCRVGDQPQWGANAIFDIVNRKMEFRSYYKLPVPQTITENCVAHNGSILPVPGRDIMSQGWYQGGVSVIDFTDSRNPKEIAFFDRGPVSATSLVLGGFWTAYWYNGQIYGSELARGIDVFGMKASEHLTAAEIGAAREVRLPQFNPQHQPKITWAPSFNVSRARFDQLVRTCTSTVTGRRNGPLLVSGVTCLNNATVNGTVVVAPGGSLLAINSTVSGAVASLSADAVHLYNTTVRGALALTGTTGSMAIVDSTVNGATVLLANSTGTVEQVVARSRINGLLVCTANNPAPINLGGRNTVRGLNVGQCAPLD